MAASPILDTLRVACMGETHVKLPPERLLYEAGQSFLDAAREVIEGRDQSLLDAVREAAEGAKKAWGGEPKDITHIVLGSTKHGTGLSPSPSLSDLLQHLGIQPNVEQALGCTPKEADWKAREIVKTRPRSLVMVLAVDTQGVTATMYIEDSREKKFKEARTLLESSLHRVHKSPGEHGQISQDFYAELNRLDLPGLTKLRKVPEQIRRMELQDAILSFQLQVDATILSEWSGREIPEEPLESSPSVLPSLRTCGPNEMPGSSGQAAKRARLGGGTEPELGADLQICANGDADSSTSDPLLEACRNLKLADEAQLC